MTAVDSIARQLAHAAWANATLIDALDALRDPPPKALRWIAHVLGAEEVWLERIAQSERSVRVWPDLTLDECRRLASSTASRWQALLRVLTPERLSERTTYRNSKGELWDSTIHDIMIHVVIHGAHHRGQIVADMRASGAEPPYLDYIHAARHGLIA